jgi:hypothetical protein
MPGPLKGLVRQAFPAPVEVLSVHVPKTAGSSFRSVLMAVYGDRLYLDYSARMNRPTGARGEFEAARRRSFRAVPRNARAIHGHWPLAGYADGFPKAARIVWLREPVDRLISHYFFWKQSRGAVDDHPLRHELWDSGMSLIDFARKPQMRDIVATHYLRGYDLSDLSFVGITEHFEIELQRLAAFLHWPRVAAPRVNPTTHEDYVGGQVPEEVRLEIARLNSLDMELYRRARAESETVRKAAESA